MKQRFTILSVVSLTLLAVVVTACAPKAAPSVTPEDFYAKNVVTLQVGYTPGGGTDFGARVFASFWRDATGGAMAVENKPGAAGLEAPNYVYAAKPDGLTLGTEVLANDLYWWLFEAPGAKFKLAEFQIIGFYLDEPQVFAIAAGSSYSGKKVADLQKAEGLKVGAGSPQGNMAVGSAMTMDFLGLKNAKLIVGYQGSAGLGVAAGRGEIDAAANISTSVKEQVPKFFNAPVLTVGRQRSDHWPDAPAITEVAKLTPEQNELLDYYLHFKLGKIIYAPPGVSKDRIAYLRQSFDKIMKMNGFLQQVKARWPIWIPPVSADEIAKEIATVVNYPADKRARFTSAIGKYMQK